MNVPEILNRIKNDIEETKRKIAAIQADPMLTRCDALDSLYEDIDRIGIDFEWATGNNDHAIIYLDSVEMRGIGDYREVA